MSAKVITAFRSTLSKSSLLLLAIMFLQILCACSGSADEKSGAITSAAPQASGRLGDICRLVISLEMGRPVEIIRIDNEESGLASVSYVRQDDGKEWKYQCKIDGGAAYWRAVDLFAPGGGPGRWRDDPAENRHTYTESNGKLVVQVHYPDGSVGQASLN